jgi:S-(hydroxymethyl)glutathione dehydrogenase / alcohol dehydrogenase
MAVGLSGIEQVLPFNMELFEWDERYINPLYGHCRPSMDFPVLLPLYQQKRLKLDEMAGLAEAFDHMRRGLNAKGVLIPQCRATRWDRDSGPWNSPIRRTKTEG